MATCGRQVRLWTTARTDDLGARVILVGGATGQVGSLVVRQLRADGAPVRATLGRAYPTLRRFRRITGRTVERHGFMVVPGPPSARQAFLSVHDAARGLAAAVRPGTRSGPVDLGGPEVLTWTDVARIYERVLGRRVRVVSQPVAAFAVAQRLFTPVAPSLAGVMALNRLMGSSQTDWDTTHAVRQLGLDAMRTVEEILREKAALPPIR